MKKYIWIPIVLVWLTLSPFSLVAEYWDDSFHSGFIALCPSAGASAVTASGNDIYVAGGDGFIYKWTGSTGTWSQVGNGWVNGSIRTMFVYSGDLYAGGTFDQAGSSVMIAATNIARLRLSTSAWSALGKGLGVAGDVVRTIKVAVSYYSGSGIT